MSGIGALDGLRRDHSHMRSVLMLVAHQLDHLEEYGAADYVLLANALYYMCKFPSHVHHPKEDLIFQRLSERDSTWKGEVDKLLAQHGEIYTLEDELMERVLDHPPAGSEAVRELLDKGRRYLQLQRQHSETEERLLFPQAEIALTAKDWAGIGSHIREVDDPLFGRHATGRYRMLYEHLMRDQDAV